MIQRNTFVSVMKDLYYAQCESIKQLGNVSGSTRFVHCMRAVLDGASQFIAEAHPHYGPYSHQRQDELYWRITLFNDELALWLLRENANKFFDAPAK